MGPTTTLTMPEHHTNHSPIHAIQGTVDIHTCSADRTVSTTVYVAMLPCQPLISRDLIDGLGLTIQGRGALKTEDSSSVIKPKLPLQSPLILKV